MHDLLRDDERWNYVERVAASSGGESTVAGTGGCGSIAIYPGFLAAGVRSFLAACHRARCR
jgi:hypothetical protein